MSGTALHMHIVDFQHENPQCKAEIVRDNYDGVMKFACGDEPYLTITTRPTNTEAFDVIILHKVQYHLLMPKGHPFSKHKIINLNDLGDTMLILSAELFRANQYLMKHFTEDKTSINLYLEAGGFQAGLELCRQGAGVMLLADYVETQFDIDDLAKVPSQSGLSDLELVLLVQKNAEYSLLEHKFIEHMKTYARAYSTEKNIADGDE